MSHRNHTEQQLIRQFIEEHYATDCVDPRFKSLSSFYAPTHRIAFAEANTDGWQVVVLEMDQYCFRKQLIRQHPSEQLANIQADYIQRLYQIDQAKSLEEDCLSAFCDN